MRSKGDISNKSGRHDANPFPSPPSHRSLLLSFLFSGACSPGNTRRHVKKTHEKDRIQLYHLPLYRYLSSIQAIVLKNRARRFAYNNVHCIFEQWEDPPPSSPFPPSLPPYLCFFQRQDQASRALINGGKRQTIVEFRSVIERFISANGSSFRLFYILFFFPPRYTIHRHCLLFVDQQERRFILTSIVGNFFSFLFFSLGTMLYCPRLRFHEALDA